MNGQHTVYLNVGDTIDYVWYGNNGTSYYSSYTSNIGWLCGPGGAWLASGSSGRSVSTVPSNAAGCEWDVYYTAFNANTNQNETDHIRVVINVTHSPTPSPSPSPSSSPTARINTSGYSIWKVIAEPWLNVASIILGK